MAMAVVAARSATPSRLPVAGRRPPREQDQEHGERGRPDDDRMMSEGGCQPAPDGDCRSIRACEDRREEDERAVDDEDDRDVSQHARLDRPDHAHRMLVRLRLDERVDDHPAQEAPEGGDHEADEDEARPGRAQQQPAPPLREVDRECVEGEDGDHEQRAQRLEDLHRRLGGARAGPTS